METHEFEVGPDHVIVVYAPADLGVELDPCFLPSQVADDAARWAGNGQRIVA
jgi:hypothetical protein